MSLLDQYLLNQAMKPMGNTFNSPYDRAGGYVQTYGNTPITFTGAMPGNTNKPLPNLPGGNLAFNTNQMGNLSTGFGYNMPSAGINLGMGLQPTQQRKGFGSRLADVFKDQNRFADALAGVAALTGSSASDALGIRSALRTPTNNDTTIGTVYNVLDSQGNFIKQVNSRTDAQEITQLQKEGYRIVPADASQPDQLGIQQGQLEKETIYDPNTGDTVYIGTRLEEQLGKRQAIQERRDAVINTANTQLEQIQQAKNLIGGNEPNLAQNVLNALFEDTKPARGSDAAILAGILDSLQGTNFKNVVAEMKAASKAGGALGSVSETELAVFSNLNYVLNPDRVGTGQALLGELERLEESIIRGYNPTVMYAADTWNQASSFIPSGDERRNLQISDPIPLITTNSDDTLTGGL